MAKRNSSSIPTTFWALLLGLVALLITFYAVKFFLIDAQLLGKQGPAPNITSSNLPSRNTAPEPTGNVFKDIQTRHPKRFLNAAPIPEITQVEIPLYDHNPREGESISPIKLVIFTNPQCRACMDDINAFKARITTKKIEYIYKFAADDITAIEGGLLEYMAFKQGKWPAFTTALRKLEKRIDITPNVMASILEDIDIPLRTQRDILSAHGPEITAMLGKDIDLAKKLNITELPALYLNGYRIASPHLPPQHINTYIENVRAKREIDANING